MALDTWSVVTAFLAVVQVALGLVLLALVPGALRRPGDEGAGRRRPLAALAAASLVTIAVASVPVFFLMLQSWVPRFPGLQCIEGVRRIGTDSVGPSGRLPTLVSVLDVTRPLLLFAAGAWLVLRRLPVTRPATLALGALGMVACVDGAAAAAFTVIPREEVRIEAGCCAGAGALETRDDGLTADSRAPDDDGGGASSPLLFTSASVLLGAGALGLRAGRSRSPGAGLPGPAILATAAFASVPLAVRFLVDTASPALLALPFHHCAWCAFADAPESMVGALLFLGAVFCTGWTLLARIAGGAPADDDTGRSLHGKLLAMAAFGFLGVAGMAVVTAVST